MCEKYYFNANLFLKRQTRQKKKIYFFIPVLSLLRIFFLLFPIFRTANGQASEIQTQSVESEKDQANAVFNFLKKNIFDANSEDTILKKAATETMKLVSLYLKAICFRTINAPEFFTWDKSIQIGLGVINLELPGETIEDFVNIWWPRMKYNKEELLDGLECIIVYFDNIKDYILDAGNFPAGFFSSEILELEREILQLHNIHRNFYKWLVPEQQELFESLENDLKKIIIYDNVTAENVSEEAKKVLCFLKNLKYVFTKNSKSRKTYKKLLNEELELEYIAALRGIFPRAKKKSVRQFFRNIFK